MLKNTYNYFSTIKHSSSYLKNIQKEIILKILQYSRVDLFIELFDDYMKKLP